MKFRIAPDHSPILHWLLVERDRLQRRYRGKREQGFTNLRLERTTCLDGAAAVSHPESASFLQSVATELSQRTGCLVVPSMNGNELKLALRAEDIGVLDTILCERIGERPLWRDARRGNRVPRVHNVPYIHRKGSSLRVLITRGVPFTVRIVAFCYVAEGNSRHCEGATGWQPRRLHEPLPGPTEQPLGIADFLSGKIPGHVHFPIDVVYTWVNDQDPVWRDMYRTAKSSDSSSEEIDGQSIARFRNREELRYSLRSIDMYIPWVRNVYVFTNCSAPSWIAESSRIFWIDHKDVIPERHLPTFNSHVIESYLHRIPNLSQHFLYFNDDVLVNRRMAKTTFFNGHGCSIPNLENYGTVNGRRDESAPDYLNAARNCVGLLSEKFGFHPTQLHAHSPHALRKDVLRKIEETWPDEIEQTRRAQFRKQTDISMVSFLYHHFAFLIGLAVPTRYSAALVKPTSKNFEKSLSKMAAGRLKSNTVCINDGKGSKNNQRWDSAVRRFLLLRFSTPLIDELPDS